MPMLRLARKILMRLRPYRWVFTVAVVQVLVMGALELLKPWPLKLIVDHVLMGYPAPWPWLHSLEPRALLLVGCVALILIYALIGAFSVISNYVTIGLGQRLVNDFRAELHAHLQRLSLAFHNRREVGGSPLPHHLRHLCHPDAHHEWVLPCPDVSGTSGWHGGGDATA